MAPRAEGSHLKRARASGSPADAGQDSFKKPRRSERISSQHPDKTPISTKQQLPSPVTHPASDGEDEPAARLIKEATATPPEGRPSQVQHRDPEDNYSQRQVFSSPPQDTQAFASQQIDPNAPLSDEVEDEVKEGVWGYLFPMDTRYGGRCVVLRKRGSCPKSNTVAEEVAPKKRGGKGQKGGPLKEEQSFDQTRVNGRSSGGYLIGRHPECDIVVDDPIVSNRHCLLFQENKGTNAIAILEDLSSNGTFINEGIVGRNQRRELQEDDEIAVLDKARFVFKYPKSRTTSEFLNQYTPMEKLGKGHFAEVYLCVEKSTGQKYAVKVFTKKPGVEERSKNEGLQQEIAVLMGVNHPNVLCLKDTFNEPGAVYLVLELAPGGELFNLIVKKTKLTEGEARKLFLQLFQGVKYLHDRGIVHRDIKPENILLVDDDLHVKLADFGLAKIIGEESFTTTLCGTPSYVAPEILTDTRRRKYTKAVDIWSLGVVLYICLCGFPPFSDELTNADFPLSLSEQIRKGQFDYPSPYWDSVGDPALDLIDSMLVTNPEKRFTIDQCLAHPWLTQSAPGVNDSTNGLVDGVAGLEMSRRGVVRERTLLSSINTVQATNRIPMGGGKPDMVITAKNAGAVNNAIKKEPGPADARQTGEFMAMGGKGDQVLFDYDGSNYSVHDIASGRTAGPSVKAKKGKKSGR